MFSLGDVHGNLLAHCDIYFNQHNHNIVGEEEFMIFNIAVLKMQPFTKGKTTLEDFIQDQFMRRRFLGKYSTKLFPKIKRCKNKYCDNYHDNKNYYCSDECRNFSENNFGADPSFENKKVCSNCEHYVPHHSGIRVFLGRCVEKTLTSHGYVLVSEDKWCTMFSWKTKTMGRSRK